MSTAFLQTGSQDPSSLYQPNGVLRWVSSRFFRHIDVEARWTDAVRAAAERGSVVYVMRSLSVLDFLCLDYLTKANQLPAIQFVNDLGTWFAEPLGRGTRKRSNAARDKEEVALGRTLEQHGSALLFLRRPPRLGSPSRKGENIDTDFIRVLIEAQRRTQWPILLVPQTFIWGKLAGKQQSRPLDFLLGPIEWPGRVRTFFRFMLNYRNALLRTGEAFDLKAFLDANPTLSDAEAADKVRYALLRRMERERTVVVGPNKKTPQRLREEIMRSPRLRKHINAIVRVTGRDVEDVESEVERELRKLCATPDEYSLWLLHRLLDRVWNKIYDGIDVDQEGLARVREAARHGPLILMPSHKSHVDYLVLSDVFYTHQLSPPLIAAGDNLSFWPLGWILRRGGAFFIRRSFKGNRLYGSIVDTYMRRLLLDGHHIELFIEGGRSRTGKLLPPKFGLLSMLVDACLALKDRTINFVPISVGYELIVEQQSYVDELSGAEKQKENIGGLLKTREVLRSRYGRLYIQFGEVMSFDKLVEDAVGADAKSRMGELSPERRRHLVQRIGHRSTYEINRVTVVTPVALVSTCFMIHRRRGLPRAQLAEVATLLRDALRRMGARLAPTIDGAGPINQRALEEAVSLLRDGKLVVQHGEGRDTVYTVPEERRVALEYYKNNVIHFFVARALISAALQVREDERAVSESALRERVQKISRLFKYEFMYRADTDFDQIFDDALGDMLRDGEIERFSDSDRVRPTDDLGHRVSIYASMVRTYFEAYLLAARGVLELPPEGITRKEWLKRTLALGKRLYFSGELEDMESISSHKLENAFQALRDHGLVRAGAKGIEPVPGASETVPAWIDEIRGYLK